MSINIEVRKKQLESLNQYIKSSKDNVQAILKLLGWTAKKVLENDKEKVKCPLNVAHTTTIENAPSHIAKCNLKCAGYDLNEEFLSEPLNHPNASITLDNAKKVEILNRVKQANPKFRPAWNAHAPDPMTVDRLTSTYSPDERLALYNYCIKNTEGPPVPLEINFSSDDKNNKDENPTYEQLLEKLRDSKRRRIKYKSVHTNKKTYTEVIREVIENQMELYKEWIASQQVSTSNEETIENEKLLIEDYDQCIQNYENVQNYYGNVPDYFSDEPNYEKEASEQISQQKTEINDYNQKVEDFLNKTVLRKSPDRPRSSISGHSRTSSSSRRKNGKEDRYYEKQKPRWKYEERSENRRKSSPYTERRGRHYNHREIGYNRYGRSGWN